jgi:hypothetical protein
VLEFHQDDGVICLANLTVDKSVTTLRYPNGTLILDGVKMENVEIEGVRQLIVRHSQLKSVQLPEQASIAMYHTTMTGAVQIGSFSNLYLKKITFDLTQSEHAVLLDFLTEQEKALLAAPADMLEQFVEEGVEQVQEMLERTKAKVEKAKESPSKCVLVDCTPAPASNCAKTCPTWKTLDPNDLSTAGFCLPN